MAQTNHTMPTTQLPPHRMPPTSRTYQHHHTKHHQSQPLPHSQQKQPRPNFTTQSLSTKHSNHIPIWHCSRLRNQPWYSSTPTAPHKWLHLHTRRMDTTCHTNQAPKPTQTQKHRSNTPQMATPIPQHNQPHSSFSPLSHNPRAPQLQPQPHSAPYNPVHLYHTKHMLRLHTPAYHPPTTQCTSTAPRTQANHT